MTKYSIKLSDIEKPGEIHKLERDGFTRSDIHRAMYRETDGASTTHRTELMRKLYTRHEQQGGNYNQGRK